LFLAIARAVPRPVRSLPGSSELRISAGELAARLVLGSLTASLGVRELAARLVLGSLTASLGV
jgi:hypothetical protein